MSDLNPYIYLPTTTKHEYVGECWALNGSPMIGKSSQTTREIKGTISLWKNHEAMNRQAIPIDHIFFSIDIDRIALLAGEDVAILDFIITNSMVFSSNGTGQVDFADGVLMIQNQE